MRRGQIKMIKLLLVNPSFANIYLETKLANMTHPIPPLSLACIAGSAMDAGADVKAFDFNLDGNTLDKFKETLAEYNPTHVGITFVTPLFNQAKQLVSIVKKLNKNIVCFAGGVHCSSYPIETIKQSKFDVAIVGEGDFAIQDLIKNKPIETILGIAYRNGNLVILNPRDEPLKNLDLLPFPEYRIYEIDKYRVSKTLARYPPVAWMESSRGCVYGCVYCNKNIFGRNFRVKSPGRVVEEMQRLKAMGVNEIHFTDDAFTTDVARAKRICDLIVEKEVNIHWALVTGIRVNQVDYELLCKMKKAGCYKVFFGIESGNQEILNGIKKGITLEQVRTAVNYAHKAGIEVWGAFMIGLPNETEQTMRDTINFAKSLPLDLAKISILIPLPSTPIFEEWQKKGYIKTKDWDKFCFYTAPKEVYDHPNLSWDLIQDYYDKFYREFYFRPSFIIKRFLSSIRRGTLIDDMKILVGTRW